jgi:putative MATE family efflux protein
VNLASRDPARPGLVAITWPLFTELLLATCVALAGLTLAARVSDAAAGAFVLSQHVWAAFFLLFRVVSMGASVVVTQQLGAGDRAGADQSARAALGASLWLGLGTAATVALGAGVLLGLLSTPAAVRTLAEPFLRLLALGLVLDAFNACMASVVRAHLHARDVLVNTIAMHSLHLLLCMPLMAAFGLPGFALALLVSRSVGLAFHLWLWQRRLNLVPKARDWWTLRSRRLAPMLHIGLPGAAENVAWRIVFIVTVSFAAGLGEKSLATHGYTIQVQSFILLFALATGFASEILVGHMIGAGDLHGANRLVRRSLRIGVMVSTGLALAAALAGPWLMRHFTSDAQIVQAAATLLWLAVLVEPGRVLNIVHVNALRATGDARFPVAAGVVSMVLVMGGGAWLLGVHFGLGLPGLWIAYAADEWLRGLAMAARWKRRGWLPHARATHRRVTRRRRALADPFRVTEASRL